MSATHFRVTYDGPALAEHEMDVRGLAPALLAVAELLDAATRVLHAERAKAQVNVRASFKTGSFGIDFSLATDWLLQARDLFLSENTTAALNAFAVLGFLGLITGKAKRGLVSVIKWLRGRRIERIEPIGDMVRIHVEEEHLDVERAIISLLRDLRVRRALQDALAPLGLEGVDTFASGDDNNIAVTIRSTERVWFQSPEPEDDLILEDERKMAFSIVSLAFREDNKWRLYDGAATIYATISDTEFLDRVDANQEIFAKGDVLVCLVRVRQWQTVSGARTEYDVIRVLEHRQAARQLRLPIDPLIPARKPNGLGAD